MFQHRLKQMGINIALWVFILIILAIIGITLFYGAMFIDKHSKPIHGEIIVYILFGFLTVYFIVNAYIKIKQFIIWLFIEPYKERKKGDVK